MFQCVVFVEKPFFSLFSCPTVVALREAMSNLKAGTVSRYLIVSILADLQILFLKSKNDTDTSSGFLLVLAGFPISKTK